MKRVFGLRPAGIALCLVLLPAGGHAQDNSWNNKDWRDFGRNEIATAPPHIRSGSHLLQAQWLAMRVSDMLVAKRLPANTSGLGRAEAWWKTGDREVGTCGDLTNKLEEAFLGAGLANTSLGTAKRISGSLKASVAREDIEAGYVTENEDLLHFGRQSLVNNDHGALMVLIDGKPYVFDLWLFAYKKGGDLTFAGFPGSKFNGLPLEDWGREMILMGYKQFQIVEGEKETPWGSLKAAAAKSRDAEPQRPTPIGQTRPTWRDVDLSRPVDGLSTPEKQALCGCISEVIRQTKGERRGFRIITAYTYDAASNLCTGGWEYFEFKTERPWPLEEARNDCRQIREKK